MNLIDGYIERWAPMAQRVGATAGAYAERIIARLDGIYAAVQSEEFEEARQIFRTDIGAGATVNVGTIRGGESWELESVVATGAGDVNVWQDGQLRWSNAFAGRSTALGSGVILTGPGEVTISCSTAITIVAQFKRKVQKVGKLTRNTGMIEPPPELLGRGAEESRHFDAGVRARQTAPGVQTR